MRSEALRYCVRGGELAAPQHRGVSSLNWLPRSQESLCFVMYSPCCGSYYLVCDLCSDWLPLTLRTAMGGSHTIMRSCEEGVSREDGCPAQGSADRFLHPKMRKVKLTRGDGNVGVATLVGLQRCPGP